MYMIKRQKFPTSANFISVPVYAKMGFRRMISWILITLLSLAFIVHVDGASIKAQMVSVNSQNATQERNNNITQDYEIDYYEYPNYLFLNETLNDTYDLGAFYDDYYDYYGPYEYPELDAYYYEMDDNDTQTTIPNLAEETQENVAKTLRRMIRSLPEKSKMKHLCIMNQLNVTHYSDKYASHIFECKDKEIKHFACFDSEGFIKPCHLLKAQKKPEVSLCVINESASYVTICNPTEPQSVCFRDTKLKNRIFICDDKKVRVCFREGLTICNNQQKKRAPRAIGSYRKSTKKPYVNCNNCKVEVKMLVDEMDENSTPKIQIKVSRLKPSNKFRDAYDTDFDK